MEARRDQALARKLGGSIKEKTGVKLMPNCKDITRMTLAGEDRRLGAGARLVIRAHRLFCTGCNNFGKQLVLMRQTATQWRSDSQK
ncbi:anti-sigma factor family protein [Roseateles albus]|uniref:Uncharacterized protein n=1 Tax=Roseateles albus TaxID=2987525 RepID=A0ABT5KJH5_9BURK|nr:hypothetical protein [Roseateles albus]MDC8774036.1 hypothetical protein [Roseateles albus]